MKKNLKSKQKYLSAEERVKIARDSAIQATIAIVLTALVDGEEHYDIKRVQRLWDRINKLSAEITEGRITVADFVKVLKQEYQIYL